MTRPPVFQNEQATSLAIERLAARLHVEPWRIEQVWDVKGPRGWTLEECGARAVNTRDQAERRKDHGTGCQ